MSFTFGFTNDDIDDAEEPTERQLSIEQKISIESGSQVRVIFHELTSESPNALLTSLPSSIYYDLFPVKTDSCLETQSELSQPDCFARRSMFDIRAQLMAEADISRNDNDHLLSAMDESDLTQGTYEGGFKTWEGAFDLARLLLRKDVFGEGQVSHVIELGAGSALPSVVALTNVLQQPGRQRCMFTICDYNNNVLELTTAPNILLATALGKMGTATSKSYIHEGYLEVDQGLVSNCVAIWRERDVHIRLLSGPWGKDLKEAILSNTASKDEHLLLLASETIYELSSLSAFTDLVLDLLRCHGDQSRAWIAAKRVYFGVGGGAAEFCTEVRAKGGNVSEIVEVKDQGVARVVLEVTISHRL